MTTVSTPRAVARQSDRLHAMDAVRAAALLLGVFLHTSLSFWEPRFWLVGDVSHSPTANVIFYVIRIFRMSVFFLIAGFFGRLVLNRRDSISAFIRDRSRRILIPLLIFWPLMMVAVVPSIVLGAKLAGETPPPAPPFTVETVPLWHLWFLYWLLILYAGALIVRGLVVLVDRNGTARARIVDPIMRVLVKSGLIVVAAALPIFLALMVQPGWQMWFGLPLGVNGLIPSESSLLAYAVAFTVGWLLHRQQDLLEVWRRQHVGYLVAAVGLTVFSLWMIGLDWHANEPTHFNKVVYTAAYVLAIWTWTVGLIGLALRYLDKERPAIRYIADASYWIYLVHFAVVIALQAALSRLDLPWFVKYVMILAIAFPLVVLVYHFVIRNTRVGAFITGRVPQPRRRKKSTVDTAPPAVPEDAAVSAGAAVPADTTAG